MRVNLSYYESAFIEDLLRDWINENGAIYHFDLTDENLDLNVCDLLEKIEVL